MKPLLRQDVLHTVCPQIWSVFVGCAAAGMQAFKRRDSTVTIPLLTIRIPHNRWMSILRTTVDFSLSCCGRHSRPCTQLLMSWGNWRTDRPKEGYYLCRVGGRPSLGGYLSLLQHYVLRTSCPNP